jgi:hypothetical protein
MKKQEQIQDELAVLKQNLANHPDTEAWMKLYKKLPSEDRQLLVLAQSPTLLQQEIGALEWVLKDAPDKPEVGYLDGEEIPYEISIKLSMYHGRNIHDVNKYTYLLKGAYKDENQRDIEKYIGILRKFVNGI